ncbi:MAG: hypothetical protein AAF982_08880 [Pseudomonadota bacterium]
MKTMPLIMVAICFLLASCGRFPSFFDRSRTGEGTTAATSVPATTQRPLARPDTGAPVPDDAFVGITVASLGAPGEPGLWAKTPLVTSERRGRLVYPAKNTSVTVVLIPIDGPASAGSRVSLDAFRLLGVALTDLPELEVHTR